MIDKIKLIDTLCWWVCVTPEEVFSTFGAISKPKSKYEYIDGKLVNTGEVVFVYLLGDVLAVDSPDMPTNNVVYILEKAFQQLSVEELETIKGVWLTRMIASGYGDRLNV